MIAHGKYVQVGIQNLSEWTSQLQILLMDVINVPVETDIEKQVSEIAALVDQMLNGVDINTNGVVEPLAGEAGAVTTYNESFYMADMPLLRVGVFGDFTPMATFSGSSTGGGGGGGIVEPTKKPPPGQNKTDKPAPTKKNNGNNN
jgi:hypothetical protein